ncbi:ferric reductase-like transmembrane domain-containing protein [uncultured Formosa sp.]|uniref:ferredoxin reductase family protein n=1 Tax=uncultured Formosa sp. TaxID=255435 RepID=UPI002637E09A|nr:ferric reductase-like transmembrane domain-containing protein [uncultured Formosa sp.]
MKTKNRYVIFIVLAIIIPTSLWLLTFPNTTIKHDASPFFVYGSQLLAIIGFSLFAISFVLTTRIKVIETYFGGLDKLYQKHSTIGKIAFFMILAHPIVLSLRWIPDNIEKIFWYILPIHRKMEINIGSWALIGLIVLLLFTLVIKLPYDKWKISHKFMGLCFILGSIHVFGINNFYQNNKYLAFYFILITTLALIAFMYKSIFYKWTAKKHPFEVLAINKLNAEVMEITLINKSTHFNYVPGQFCFFQFVNKDLSMESHPFTICDAPLKDEISILVKSLGDYTNTLHKKLTLNTTALVEGPYGCFDYKLGKKKQIWIAGGVGIAPFMSWCRDLMRNNMPELEVDFYYCVHNKSEAFYTHEFEKLETIMPNFHLNVHCSTSTGHIKGSDIKEPKDKTICICGPKSMRTSLLKEFKTLQVPKENIIYEDFDFI